MNCGAARAWGVTNRLRFVSVRGEALFSLKDDVFKTQVIKNSSSFLSVPPKN